MSALMLGIPSKGRLQEQTRDYFAVRGLSIEIDGRGYRARIAAAPGVDVRLISASEIARALRAGEVHLGVTGADVLNEADPGLARTFPLTPLGFGRADLVLAAPACWLDVATVADFAEVCADQRARTGARARVATKYPRLARRFLEAQGVGDYRLVESLGATEGAPAAGAADAIIDITTTGATLSANGLRIVEGGVILRSEALLAASRAADWDEGKHSALAALLGALAEDNAASIDAFKRALCATGADAV